MAQLQRALKLVARKDTGTQKSQEWLNRRFESITASDVSCCFDMNTFKSRKRFITEKVERFAKYAPTVATCFGDKYEPISARIYEDMYEKSLQKESRGFTCRIFHLGLLTTNRHGTPIGASLDGIPMLVDDKGEPLNPQPIDDIHIFETKAPWSRIPFDPANPNTALYKNSDPVKPEYRMQTQIQMEVSKIDQCAFLDNQFRESPHEEIPDIILPEVTTDLYHGYILSQGSGVTETIRYPTDTSFGWERIILDPARSLEWCLANVTETETILHWELAHHMLCRIQRDREWLANSLPRMTETWEEILEHRRNGTLPKKTARTSSKPQSTPPARTIIRAPRRQKPQATPQVPS